MTEECCQDLQFYLAVFIRFQNLGGFPVGDILERHPDFV